MKERFFLKSFVLSMVLHVALFAGFVTYDKPIVASLPAKVIPLSMDMYTQEEKKETIEEKIEEKKVEPETIKRDSIVQEPIKPKKKPKKIVKKQKKVEKKVAKPQNQEPLNEILTASKQKDFVRTNFGIIRDKVLKNLIYPRMAKRMGHVGTVEATLVISMDGRLIAYYITRSSGSKLLDKAAMQALQKIKNDTFPKPVQQTRIALPIGFELN
jgi:periplasmic protein TonB